MNPMPEPTADPVRVQRARMARIARAGKRLGYSLFAVAIVAFVVGAATRFTPPLVTVVVASLAVGSVFLAPAIIVGYGVRAADREDRQAGR
jgi:ABC-type Na+ efflux pump permease subunit